MFEEYESGYIKRTEKKQRSERVFPDTILIKMQIIVCLRNPQCG